MRTIPGTIEYWALTMMEAGADDEVILESVRRQFPDCDMTLACIRWYRSGFKRGYLMGDLGYIIDGH